ncbi:MAG: nicotinamidase [Hydrogenothermaceae bacterium]|nr:nicotinamidase [Hydrogenothermaceae bacterium]
MKVAISNRDALIVVDMQNDFMPLGVLPVKEADRIVPVINNYVEKFERKSLPVFFTRDWHPENHTSFRDFGGVWPSHCVAGTEGAKFYPGLKIPADNKFIISKGTSPEFDAYSGFQGTILDSLLKERGIRRVFICGVATDFCVKNTALGAINLGYQVFILSDGIKGVFEDLSETSLKLLMEEGASLVSYDEVSV